MKKLDFISKQLSKAQKKRFEHYVITRIWHNLNDLEIKFVTQQFVARPEGRALTDMFFPQLQIHIEIDEGHHKNQIQFDKLREKDIVDITGHEILRIDVTKDIVSINDEISAIVEYLQKKKCKIENFRPWDTEAEYDPKTYINKGFIELKDDCAFRTMVDAANCFGNSYKSKGLWTGGAGHAKEPNKIIWFPKLYPNGQWNNTISNDENEVREISENVNTIRAHIDKVLDNGIYKRIIFARVKGPLGDVMYRFKGEYELDIDSTNYKEGLLWRRISDIVKTYPS